MIVNVGFIKNKKEGGGFILKNVQNIELKATNTEQARLELNKKHRPDNDKSWILTGFLIIQE